MASKIKVSKQLDDALNDYLQVITHFLTKKTSGNYCTFVRSIENDMAKGNSTFSLLDNWILPELNNKATSWELLNNVLEKFDNAYKNKTHIRNYSVSDCRSALASFTKFILGQYKANLYMSLIPDSDEDYCRLIARNALFCTVEVAKKIHDGVSGSKDFNKKKGNKFYSWYCCRYQRKKPKETRKMDYIKPGCPDPLGAGNYYFDDNTQANHAIKYAIIEGMRKWLKYRFEDFEDYMACHIWDQTCYDYRYHTSVFNLVLLPTSIAGLSDYNATVKEFLQYEAAMRFGVYPQGHKYIMSKTTKSIWNKLHNEWRQPDEHQIAINNYNNNFSPTQLI